MNEAMYYASNIEHRSLEVTTLEGKVLWFYWWSTLGWSCGSDWNP